ncbi:hypothetical protein TNCV_4763231 [Trichonephila clavipes]|nr:hypothetical protein TNCV_4763231 [Trichonephila clavipes]
MDLVISNHGQVMRMTPEQAPPLQLPDCDVPLSKRVSLYQDKTKLSFGAPAAGAHYRLFRVWTSVPVQLDIQ